MKGAVKNKFLFFLVFSLLTLLAGLLLIYSIGFKPENSSLGWNKTINCSEDVWYVPTKSLQFPNTYTEFPTKTTVNANKLPDYRTFINSEGNEIKFDSDIISFDTTLSHNESSYMKDAYSINGNSITYIRLDERPVDWIEVKYYTSVKAENKGFCVISYQNFSYFGTTNVPMQNYSYNFGTGRVSDIDGDQTINMDALIYPKRATITYNTKGGKFAGGGTFEQIKTLFCEKYITPEEEPTKKGCEFLGWGLPESGLFTDYENGTKIDAVWFGDKYENLSFSLEANGPSIVYAGDNIRCGNLFDFPTFEYAQTYLDFQLKPGYKFVGWEFGFEDEDGTKYEYLIKPGTQEIPYLGSINAVKKFVAKYEPISYQINFDSNGATSGYMYNQTFNYDDLQILNENVFFKTGYHFDGWQWVAIKRDIGNSYWETTEIENPQSFVDRQEILNLIAEDNVILVFKAVWQANAYTIVFHSNYEGGPELAEMGPYKYDEEIMLPTFHELSQGITKPGFIVSTSWYKNADAKGDDYSTLNPVKNLSSVAGDVVHLYANWQHTWAGKDVADSEPVSEIKNGVKTYYISSPQNLAWVSLQFHKLGYRENPAFDGFKGVNFIQTKDISLFSSAGVSGPLGGLADLFNSIWMPIGNKFNPFRGSYDGGGHYIDFLIAITDLEKSGGLFGEIQDGSLKNIKIKVGLSIPLAGSLLECYGVISGVTKNAVIENCVIDSGVSAMFGELDDCQVKDCIYNNPEINGYDYVGCLTNKAVNSSIYNCKIVSGTLVGENYVGILAGRTFGGRVENCIAIGIDVKAKDNVGFIGYAEATQLKFCLNESGFIKVKEWINGVEREVDKATSITGVNNVGGMVGRVGNTDSGIKVSIQNCFVKYAHSSYNHSTTIVSSINGNNCGGMVGFVSSDGVDIISSVFEGKFNYEENANEVAVGLMVASAKDTSVIYIKNCIGRIYRNVGNYNRYNFHMVADEGAQITSCVVYARFENDYMTSAYFYEGDFSGWTFSMTYYELMPEGFSWLGNAKPVPLSKLLVETIYPNHSAVEKGLH